MKSHWIALSTLALGCPTSAQSSSLHAVERSEIGGDFVTTQYLGTDVFRDGATAIVLYGTSGNFFGMRHFQNSQAGWIHLGLLPTGAWERSTSYQGDLVLAGYPWGPGGGRVAVVRRGAFQQWTYTFLDGPDPSADHEAFGFATAIDGTTVVVANYLHTRTFDEEGALYVYEDVGDDLVLKASLYGGAVDAHLGRDLALQGDDLLARFEGPTGGDVRSYRRDAGAWNVLQSSVGVQVDTCFARMAMDRGLAVAVEGDDTLVVLANAGGPWFVDQSITLPPSLYSCPIDYALQDGVIACSDTLDSTAGTQAGAVLLYARNDGWKFQDKVIGSDTQPYDFFGSGLGLWRDHLMVGAPPHDHFGLNQGAVYEFDLYHSPARVSCVPERTSIGCVAHIGFQGTPSASSGQAFTLTASDVVSHRSSALVYGLGAAIFQPYPGGVRCVAPPRSTVARQSSGGSSSASDCSGALSADFNALVQSGVDPALAAGVRVTAQWFFRDPSGPSALASSEAVEFAIDP